MIELPGPFELLVPQFEGRRLRAYLDSAGFRTIGIGHLYPRGPSPITDDECDAFFQRDAQTALRAAILNCPGIANDERRLSAIADFAFNLGGTALASSTLRKRVNSRDWLGAQREIRRWNHAGGKVNAGLTRRRNAEAELLVDG